MKLLIQFIAGCILIPLIDFVWIGMIMKSFYMREMGPIMNMVDGKFQPRLLPAGVVYILLSAGLLAFVLPVSEGKISTTFIYGLVFGLVTYGVYDFTNFSTLQNWSLKLSLTDMAWGGILCGLTAVLMSLIGQKFA